MTCAAMKVLVLPREGANPYRDLLYREMRDRGARVSYLGTRWCRSSGRRRFAPPGPTPRFSPRFQPRPMPNPRESPSGRSPKLPSIG
jgi:hypothetical protein